MKDISSSFHAQIRLRRRAFAVSLCASLTILLLSAAFASAGPEHLFRTPLNGQPGSGAGQLANPRDIVVNPDTGHFYVTEGGGSPGVSGRISEFTAWGEFVKAWGWDVAPDGAPGDTTSDQLEVCTTICKAAAIEGDGVGQINGPRGAVLDAGGNLYIQESPLHASSKRVQKFSPDGQFLLMFGGQVDKTKVALREQQEANSETITVTPDEENVCTAASGDVCGAGVSGAENGYFSSGSVGNSLAYDPTTETIYVGDKDRIQEFDSDGAFKGKIDFEGSLDNFDGKTVYALAADPASGDLYLDFFRSIPPDPAQVEQEVFRLDPMTETVTSVLDVEAPGKGMTVDVDGNVYVTSDPKNTNAERINEIILGFDATGRPIPGLKATDRFGEVPRLVNQADRSINGLATNLCVGSASPGNLYAVYFASGEAGFTDAWGTPPIGCEPPPERPPEITSQFATSVDTDTAVLKAEINPRFWTDATYYVQYGTEKCSEGGCAQTQPLAPGRALTTKSTSAVVRTAGLLLADLQPGTTYHYRFVARSGGSHGEDAIGVGGAPGAPGEEATFRTFSTPIPQDGCPGNSQFRNGAGARLPDCRAYEMVTPLDKNNGDILSGVNVSGYNAGLSAAAATGERLTYSSLRAFADPESAPYAAQFLAARRPLGSPGAGWSSKSLSVPMTRPVVESSSDAAFTTPFKVFSEDLCTAWLRTVFDPPLTGDAVPGFANIYRRENCGQNAGALEALTTVTPPNLDPKRSFAYEFQGASVDGSHQIFIASDNLIAGMPAQPETCISAGSPCRQRLYESVEGVSDLRFVCVLPNGNPTSEACSAGTYEQNTGESRQNNTRDAISADGQAIYWTEGTDGPGRIFVRLAGEPASRRVSQTISGAKARFWGASVEDGRTAVFQMTDGPLAGNLYRFDLTADSSTPIADRVLGVVGMSDDTSRVYFVSTAALTGAGQNSEGKEAVEGKPNLYLEEQGAGTRFVGTLAGEGASTIPTPYATHPYLRASRVTPDGLHAAFMTVAPLTGYDNLDAESGKPTTEVFRYDATANGGAGLLACVSCNPSGARPSGRELSNAKETKTGVWAAAKIPGFERDLYASRVLSRDGTRVFFESYEALVPRDANGVQDVYQWEELGVGSCDADDSGFVPDSADDPDGERSGGCIELISSGQSPRDSSFVDANDSGSDAFFATLSSLVPRDTGLIDIYDARVGGGFPPPAAPDPACEGEACQGPIAAPNDPTPASSSFEGAGNVVEEKPKAKPKKKAKRCPKGKRKVKHKGKVRCQKAKKKHKAKGKRKHHRKANNGRRAGR